MFLFILFGVLPEVLFYFYFFVIGKDLKKDKKALVFLASLFITYMGIKMFFKYSIYFHLLYISLNMIVLKILYGKSIKTTDIFLFSTSLLVIATLSAIAYYAIPNYAVALVVNRISLLLTIIFFKKHIRELYLKYNSLWNRNRQNPNKIRSLTIRNISIIVFNLMIFGIDLLLNTLK